MFGFAKSRFQNASAVSSSKRIYGGQSFVNQSIYSMRLRGTPVDLVHDFLQEQASEIMQLTASTQPTPKSNSIAEPVTRFS